MSPVCKRPICDHLLPPPLFAGSTAGFSADHRISIGYALAILGRSPEGDDPETIWSHDLLGKARFAAAFPLWRRSASFVALAGIAAAVSVSYPPLPLPPPPRYTLTPLALRLAFRDPSIVVESGGSAGGRQVGQGPRHKEVYLSRRGISRPHDRGSRLRCRRRQGAWTGQACCHWVTIAWTRIHRKRGLCGGGWEQ